MEQRHDWTKMAFTPELFKYVFVDFIPEVIIHSKSQDEEQVRDHYDRKSLSVSLRDPKFTLFDFQAGMTFTNGSLVRAWYIPPASLPP